MAASHQRGEPTATTPAPVLNNLWAERLEAKSVNTATQVETNLSTTVTSHVFPYFLDHTLGFLNRSLPIPITGTPVPAACPRRTTTPNRGDPDGYDRAPLPVARVERSPVREFVGAVVGASGKVIAVVQNLQHRVGHGPIWQLECSFFAPSEFPAVLTLADSGISLSTLSNLGFCWRAVAFCWDGNSNQSCVCAPQAPTPFIHPSITFQPIASQERLI